MTLAQVRGISLIMKAEPSQIPVNTGQKIGLTNPGSTPGDTLWASIRRLKAQVASLELAVSTARRDINRIDRGQYRGKDKAPPDEIPDNGEKEYHPSLFG
ncbi:MAG: hypothetical protein KAJ19_28515 [Gammaproteobacteria bacterium]|nr:hypothetical protein [Gammaproteobacteria bacterium]